MKFRYLYALAVLILPAIIGTGCALIAPAPTPLPLFPTATALPSASATAAPPPTSAPIPTATPPGAATSAPVPPTTIPPVATGNPQSQPRRITFAPGATSATMQGTTASPGLDRFVIRALAGQTMSVSISSTQGPAILIIYGADGNVLISDHAGATSWSGALPTTQDYIIDTRSIGNAAVNFTLIVTIPPLEAPTPTPQRISFAPGAASATVQGALTMNGLDQYVLRVFAGQTMVLNAVPANGNVLLVVYGADGNVLLSDHAGSPSFAGKVPSTQDYIVHVRAWGDTAPTYTLQVSIPPLPTPDPGLQAQRITFSPGGTTATVQGSLAAGASDRYVLRASVGQIMSVLLLASQGPVTLMIYGADGAVLVPSQAQATSASGNLHTTEDYFIQVNASGNTAATYTMQVTIPPLNLQPTRLSFQPGSTTATVQGDIAPNVTDRYVVRALAGQTMTVMIASPKDQVVVMVWGTDGQILIPDHADATHWTGRLPATQDYIIGAWSSGSASTSYSLQVTIPPK